MGVRERRAQGLPVPYPTSKAKQRERTRFWLLRFPRPRTDRTFTGATHEESLHNGQPPVKRQPAPNAIVADLPMPGFTTGSSAPQVWQSPVPLGEDGPPARVRPGASLAMSSGD